MPAEPGAMDGIPVYDHLLEVRGLRTFFFTPGGVIKAVNDVSFDLDEGQILGLVGENGSGKTMMAMSLLRLVPPGWLCLPCASAWALGGAKACLATCRLVTPP